MENRALPYQAVGGYVLFRKLEEGVFSDLWRGTAVDGPSRGVAVAIRRFKTGDLVALRAAASTAHDRLRELSGATIARDQIADAADGSALLVHEYAGGRSLRGIAERAARPAAPHPIPVDQALAIAERVSASLQALHAFRQGSARLVHGAVLPEFVWITEDGEVRLAGQHLAQGIIASLKDPAVRAEIGPFLAPEIRAGGAPSIAGDVYSVGALLFHTLTGKVPPQIGAGDSIAGALDGATLQFDDEPIPAELRAILEKCFAEAGRRYASYDDLHQAISRAAASGEYAPTTFNLAFYVHTLMKKEREEEAEERRREESADLAAIAARAKDERKASAAATAAAATAAAPPPADVTAAPAAILSPLSQPERSRSRAPLFAAAAVLLVAAGAGAYFMFAPKGAATAADGSAALSTASMTPVPKKLAPAPVLTAIADPAPAGDTALATTTAASDTASAEEARRKAFEEEVNRRLQAEVARLQSDYEKQLAAERAKTAPHPAAEPPKQLARAIPAPAAPAVTADADGADRLNQQRLEKLREQSAPETPAAPVETASAAAREVAPPAAAAVEPPAPATREGDLVALTALDTQPALLRSVPPEYPPIAKQKKFGATLIITALVTETGDVADVRVLRGDSRNLGFEAAAIKAVRQAKFSPPMKDGKRVRVWLAMPVNFQPR
jgi:TonB family protein